MTKNEQCIVCHEKRGIVSAYGIRACNACRNFFCNTLMKNNGKFPKPCIIKNCYGCISCRIKRCKDQGMDKTRISALDPTSDKHKRMLSKVCAVCNSNKMIGCRYGAQTCSKCNQFFRSKVIRNNGKLPKPCNIKNCQGCDSCRMKKCKDEGMDESLVKVKNSTILKNIPCTVCGKYQVGGRYYGVLTCFACKKFFYKMIKRNNGNLPKPCTVNNCQGCTSCRLKKCIDKGMDKNRVRIKKLVGQTKKEDQEFKRKCPAAHEETKIKVKKELIKSEKKRSVPSKKKLNVTSTSNTKNPKLHSKLNEKQFERPKVPIGIITRKRGEVRIYNEIVIFDSAAKKVHYL